YENLSRRIYSANAYDCGGGNGEFGKRVDSKTKAVELFAKNKNVCAEFSSEIEVKEDSIVKVQFEYDSTEGAMPLYCLHIHNNPKCFNQKYSRSPDMPD